jgi:hypothetical protein
MESTTRDDGREAMRPLLRLAAIAAATFVGLSFVLFAVDQSKQGTAKQVDTLNSEDQMANRSQVVSDAAIDMPAPDRRTERVREARHTGLREVIDDGNDVLIAPFTGIVQSNNIWVERLVPAVIGLLLYGLGGMMLANFIPEPRRRHSDWRQPAS